MSGGVIRCKHCAFSTPVWRSKGKGKRVNGFDSLRRHMRKEHPSDLAAIQERVWRESEERFGLVPDVGQPEAT